MTNNKIVVKGFTPHPDQRLKIEQIENPDVKYAVLTTGRQWGKTLLAQNLILKWALSAPNLTLMWVSPVYSQARKVFSDIVKALDDTGLVVESNKSNFLLKLVNGSVIHFRSAERPDTLRGYTLDYCVVDEAGFIKDDVWNLVLKQTILVKGRKVLFISTPKGKNYLYSLSLRGNDPEQKSYLTLNGTSYDTPFISKEELDEAKKSLPEDIFRQEILGLFVDSGGEVFVDIDRYCTISTYGIQTKSTKFWAGLDLGRQEDWTVLTILDEHGNVVDFYRDRQKPWSEIVSNVVRKLQQYNASCQVEVNNVGDVLYEQLRARYYNVEPFLTTNASKQNIIEDLIYATNEGQVKLPTEELNPYLYNELKTFSYTYSPKTRRVSYGAIDGAHDDTIMSLAIAYNTLKEKRKKGVYAIY